MRYCQHNNELHCRPCSLLLRAPWKARSLLSRARDFPLYSRDAHAAALARREPDPSRSWTASFCFPRGARIMAGQCRNTRFANTDPKRIDPRRHPRGFIAPPGILDACMQSLETVRCARDYVDAPRHFHSPRGPQASRVAAGTTHSPTPNIPAFTG